MKDYISAKERLSGLRKNVIENIVFMAAIMAVICFMILTITR